MCFSKQSLSVLKNLPLQHLFFFIFFYRADNKETLSVHGGCAVMLWSALKATDSWMSAEQHKEPLKHHITPVTFKKTLLSFLCNTQHLKKDVNVMAENVTVFIDNASQIGMKVKVRPSFLLFATRWHTSAISTQQDTIQSPCELSVDWWWTLSTCICFLNTNEWKS